MNRPKETKTKIRRAIDYGDADIDTFKHSLQKHFLILGGRRRRTRANESQRRSRPTFHEHRVDWSHLIENPDEAAELAMIDMVRHVTAGPSDSHRLGGDLVESGVTSFSLQVDPGPEQKALVVGYLRLSAEEYDSLLMEQERNHDGTQVIAIDHEKKLVHYRGLTSGTLGVGPLVPGIRVGEILTNAWGQLQWIE
jgi:hypothetical protein